MEQSNPLTAEEAKPAPKQYEVLSLFGNENSFELSNQTINFEMKEKVSDQLINSEKYQGRTPLEGYPGETRRFKYSESENYVGEAPQNTVVDSIEANR